MSKKSILLFSLLILFVGLLTAADTANVWYSPHNATFSVNLADYTKYNGVADGEDYGADGYNSETLIGVLGFLRPAHKFTVTFDFNSSNDWKYISQNDYSLEIPFGLDLVLRYSYYGSHNDETKKIYHLNGESTEKTIIIESGLIDAEEASAVSGAWVDIVLTLPQSEKKYSPADDYFTSFTMTVKEECVCWWHWGTHADETASYTVYMTGYYESGSGIDDQVLFVVVPNSLSKSISVAELGLSENVNSCVAEIGDYFFTSAATESGKNSYFNESKYQMFASSTNNPLANGEMFTMRKVDNANKSFNFEIGLKSTSTGKTQWYDGTETSSGGKLLNSAFRHEETKDSGLFSWDYTLTYFDEGKILFRIPKTSELQSVEQLEAGYYESYIYLHLLVNE